MQESSIDVVRSRARCTQAWIKISRQNSPRTGSASFEGRTLACNALVIAFRPCRRSPIYGPSRPAGSIWMQAHPRRLGAERYLTAGRRQLPRMASQPVAACMGLHPVIRRAI